MEIVIPFEARVNAGGVITARGGSPGQALYWSLVGIDPVTGAENTPYGSLKYDHGKADAAGAATNVYLAPTSDADAGMTDRVKVTHA